MKKKHKKVLELEGGKAKGSAISNVPLALHL